MTEFGVKTRSLTSGCVCGVSPYVIPMIQSLERRETLPACPVISSGTRRCSSRQRILERQSQGRGSILLANWRRRRNQYLVSMTHRPSCPCSAAPAFYRSSKATRGGRRCRNPAFTQQGDRSRPNRSHRQSGIASIMGIPQIIYKKTPDRVIKSLRRNTARKSSLDPWIFRAIGGPRWAGQWGPTLWEPLPNHKVTSNHQQKGRSGIQDRCRCQSLPTLPILPKFHPPTFLRPRDGIFSLLPFQTSTSSDVLTTLTTLTTVAFQFYRHSPSSFPTSCLLPPASSSTP